MKLVKLFCLEDMPRDNAAMLMTHVFGNVWHPLYRYQVGYATDKAGIKDGVAKNQWQAVDQWFLSQGVADNEVVFIEKYKTV